MTLDRSPRFAGQFWSAFRRIGAKAHLSSGLHLQTNGQAEYAHNPLPFSSTGMSPAYPEEFQVPAARFLVHRARRAARATLLCNASKTKGFADHRRRPAPHCIVGQRVWLSSRDIPPHHFPQVSPPSSTPTPTPGISPSAVQLDLPYAASTPLSMCRVLSPSSPPDSPLLPDPHHPPTSLIGNQSVLLSAVSLSREGLPVPGAVGGVQPRGTFMGTWTTHPWPLSVRTHVLWCLVTLPF